MWGLRERKDKAYFKVSVWATERCVILNLDWKAPGGVSFKRSDQDC